MPDGEHSGAVSRPLERGAEGFGRQPGGSFVVGAVVGTLGQQWNGTPLTAPRTGLGRFGLGQIDEFVSLFEQLGSVKIWIEHEHLVDHQTTGQHAVAVEHDRVHPIEPVQHVWIEQQATAGAEIGAKLGDEGLAADLGRLG